MSIYIYIQNQLFLFVLFVTSHIAYYSQLVLGCTVTVVPQELVR